MIRFYRLCLSGRYRKVEEDSDEIQWGNSSKNMFLNVEADFDGTAYRIAN